jgi:uncharacterized repeat protein (TIGR01451 family)
VCPNIAGLQTELPAGMVLAHGKCVPIPPPPDVCPNLAGVQPEVPAGMILKHGKCVTPPSPPDACPNVAGVQGSVPAGMVKDSAGNCVVPPPTVTSTPADTPAVAPTATPVLVGTPTQTPPSVDLAVTKRDSADPVGVRRPFAYIVTVTNNGPGNATNVVLTDTMPAGLAVLSVRASQGTCSRSGRTITCRLLALATGARATETVRTQGTRAGVVVNRARVTGDGTDSTPANNATSERTRLLAPPRPLPSRCDSLTVGRRTISVGSWTTLRVHVKASGRALTRQLVRVQGPGIDRTARTNGRGVAVVTVRASRPGVIGIKAVGQPCARRIGAVGASQTTLTG